MSDRRRVRPAGSAAAPLPEALRLQTTGTVLLVVEQCSVVRVRMTAQDSPSTHGLLYFTAVQDDRHHLIRRESSRPAGTSAHAGLSAKTCSTSCVVCRC